VGQAGALDPKAPRATPVQGGRGEAGAICLPACLQLAARALAVN